MENVIGDLLGRIKCQIEDGERKGGILVFGIGTAVLWEIIFHASHCVFINGVKGSGTGGISIMIGWEKLNLEIY